MNFGSIIRAGSAFWAATFVSDLFFALALYKDHTNDTNKPGPVIAVLAFAFVVDRIAMDLSRKRRFAFELFATFFGPCLAVCVIWIISGLKYYAKWHKLPADSLGEMIVYLPFIAFIFGGWVYALLYLFFKACESLMMRFPRRTAV